MSIDDDTPSTTKQVIGLILIVGGALWMTVAGLISLGAVALLYSGAPSLSEFFDAVPMVAIIGGFLTGLGYVFYVVGWALRP
jgi:hypothetical protein